MKAAVLYSPGNLVFEEVEDPVPGPGEILARVKLALTCGTDVKLYRRGHPYARLPNIIGHEFIGVVEDVGEGVSRDIVGDTFVTMNTSPCGSCFFCRKGQENLCVKLSEEIIGFTRPGAYSEMIVVPRRIWSRYYFRVGEGVDEVEAAFLEPLSTVVHGHSVIGGVSGDSVAIIGSGPIGLLHLQLSMIGGASSVTVFDRHWEKLRVAERLGADHVVNVREEDPIKFVSSNNINGGLGFDTVIEAAGKREAWELALKLVRKGGRVLFFGGLPRGVEVSFDSYMIHYGEVSVFGAFHTTPRSVRRAYELISGGMLRLRELISGEYRLRDVREALESMARGVSLKCVIRP